ncbi:unnamed protein product [Schistosoma margrebowiei]|uniref:Uncharacterized protein n=1 Tax=Schistosoma margrebowiei TaxID=48269 RepID=A0A183M528_9TREM|nr:unnamed protein product [Schistosoma margrebowiei]
MIGYGPEDNHFVVELTYNYGIGAYQLGNDFQVIIGGSWPILLKESNSVKVEAPGGYSFWVHNSDSNGDPVQMVALSTSNLKRSIDYWSHKLSMTLVSSSSDEAVFCYSPNQCSLKLISIQKPIDHASAFGRIAFACPTISLDTPGKATVQVIILADPDGHEICFVGDEAFKQLSQVDSQADNLLQSAIASDKSDEWFNKHGGKITK